MRTKRAPFRKIKISESDDVIYRAYETEIRPCECVNHYCCGRFLVRKDSPMKICPYEAQRTGIIEDLKDYYSRTI